MSEKNLREIIKRPLLTEKATSYTEEDKKNTYVFEVSMEADKKAVRNAVESVFDVNVEKVNTAIIRGKTKRVRFLKGKRKNWKKAYVTLKEGQNINFVEDI